MKKKLEKENKNEKITFETFRKLGSYEMLNLIQSEPTCFNSAVSIKKYKITVELIEEPAEVYAERLQKIWDECDNSHHWHPIKAVAKEIGYELKNSAGSRRKR